jgi:rhodanese-related sulfurtransferase
MATKGELLAAIGDRYRASGRVERTKILDEFVAVTGYHRKHAIRLLRPKPAPLRVLPRRVHRPYGDGVREALIAALWEASDRLCSKRLKPIIPVLLPALERHGQLAIDEAIRALVLAISPATIDRLLSEVRLIARGGRRRRAGFSSAVGRTVPVRTFGDWNDPPPGFVEVDFVAHSGASAAGSFVQTMVLTDVATGWTECLPLVARNGALVIEALAAAMALFPFPLRGVDFDNDGLFMNEPVVTWCRQKGLEVARSRAYRKNDQAWVEQKNGAIVRRLVGYGRLEGLGSAQALARLYAAARLHTNLFQPSFKLRHKTRIGGRVIKRYHPPVIPADRILAHDRPVVAVCRSGSRSAQATAILREAGFADVANLAGGMLRWRAEGHPVEGGSPIEYIGEYSI